MTMSKMLGQCFCHQICLELKQTWVEGGGGGVSVSSRSVFCVCVRGVRVKNGVSLKLIKEWCLR